MKKLLFLATIILVGCATGPTFSEKKAVLSNPETVKLTGEFPSNYKSIINHDKALFKPVRYVTKTMEYGWLVCSKDYNNNKTLFLIKDGKVVLKEKVDGIISPANVSCVHYEQQQKKITEELSSKTKNNLSSISNDPSKDKLFGDYPTNPEPAIRKYLDNILFDSESARIKNFLIRKDFEIIDHEVVYGYTVGADINGKNRMGAYVGYKRQFFFIRDNLVLNILVD